jgi:hypothetical protein
VPLDFSKRVFAVDNGSGGKMPTLLDEWKSVGIREASNVMNDNIIVKLLMVTTE